MAHPRHGSRGHRGRRAEEFCHFMTEKHTLEHTLGQLLEKIKQREGADSDLLHDVETANQSFSKMDNYIQNSTETRILCHEYCPPHAQGLAKKVFDVPELLEEILTHLDVKDILGAQCVNWQFRNAVDSSTRLQRQLTFLPSKSGFVSSPFDTGSYNHGIAVMKYPSAETDSSRKPDQERELTVSVFIDDHPLKLGSTCRRILLVQPPIKTIVVDVSCRCEHDREEVHNPKGITIGDLVNHTRRLQKVHRYHTPTWRPRNLLRKERTGDPKPNVFFMARIPLQDDDPNLVEWKEWERKMDAMRDRAKEESQEDGDK